MLLLPDNTAHPSTIPHAQNPRPKTTAPQNNNTTDTLLTALAPLTDLFGLGAGLPKDAKQTFYGIGADVAGLLISASSLGLWLLLTHGADIAGRSPPVAPRDGGSEPAAAPAPPGGASP